MITNKMNRAWEILEKGKISPAVRFKLLRAYNTMCNVVNFKPQEDITYETANFNDWLKVAERELK